LAILKINGDNLLQATDDGTFMNILKNYFNSLDTPLYPNSDNPKAKNLTVGIEEKKSLYQKLIIFRNLMSYYLLLTENSAVLPMNSYVN
jgi:hypothetical protein